MATAGRGDFPEEWLMIPKGMLESEKWEPLGIVNHDLRDMMLPLRCSANNVVSFLHFGSGLDTLTHEYILYLR